MEETKQTNKEENGGSLKKRLGRVKKTRWIRFTLVSLIFIAWVIWLGSWWVILFWPLLADIYLTQYIPWTWWKNSKNKIVLSVMGWVDAILYALVLVYFIFLYFGQNYQIPSSSLEKSLLIGDYLWVNKMVYGPRVPNTPIHFPLAHNEMPIIGGKSYLDWPQWGYHRLKGVRDVERNDIVVFNFPAGDTVALKMQNPDYYSLCEVEPGGREAIKSNPQKYGEVIYRPVDRRENYVKRCLGLPGETLKIVNNVVYINGKPLKDPKNVQYNYFIQTTGQQITPDIWDQIGVSKSDYEAAQISFTPNDIEGIQYYGFKINEDNTVPPIYVVPLTNEMKSALENMPFISSVKKVPDNEIINVYPITHNYGWTHSNYGPVWIPKKGKTLKLNAYNLPIYERVIKNYEHNDLKVVDGKIFINGKEANSYTFKMNYYWMMGDNRDNSADSRYWGFVPEDHVVGTPMFIIVSFDRDKGGIRWDRILRNANPDK